MIRHVLLDADGVLQHLPGGWVDAVAPYLGDRAEEFLEAAWTDEKPALRGQGDFLVELSLVLDSYGFDVPVEEMYRTVWHSIAVVDSSVDLVHRLRAAGYGVHLGTNQEPRRAAYMRSALGYDDLFDASCYSCDVGAVKPDRAFFDAAVAMIGSRAPEVLFVDDHEGNVLGARAAGLAAEHWHLRDGLPRLLELLAGHDVTI